MLCFCGRKCIAGSCSCIDSGLKCTGLCKLKMCNNYDDDDEDEIEYDGYSDYQVFDSHDDNSDED